MNIRGNPTCRLITSSFASTFILADEIAHGEIPKRFDPTLRASVGVLQAHLGTEPAALLGVRLEDLEQAIKNRDIDLLHSSAEGIQEIIFREGLIAIAEECSRKEGG